MFRNNARHLWALAFCLALAACAHPAVVSKTDPLPSAADVPQAIEVLKKYHVNRDKVDWSMVEATALRMSQNAKTADDNYAAIRYVIAQLGEKHTFLVPPQLWKEVSSGASNDPLPEGLVLRNRIGFISVPSTSLSDGHSYVMPLRRAVSSLNAAGVCRFIIDLRDNTGGNMWWPLNGLAKLLGDAPYGHFETSLGGNDTWTLMDGTVWQPGSPPPVFPPDPTPSLGDDPVALLVGTASASAAEFVVIAFEGRSNTRLFGEATAGFTSANSPFPLSDGAMLAATVGWGFDRLGRAYKGRIVPDLATERGQATVDEAEAWLASQPCVPHKAATK